MAKVELSFVIPAFNEENSIEYALLTIDELAKDYVSPYEIVVVDDGSEDKTFSNATKYANRNGHVKVITYPTNLGKGYAVKTGFMQATGEVVVFADSDMDIDLDIIPKYVNALKHADIAIASKWHPYSSANLSISRKILSHGFNILARIFTGAKIKDTQVGLKVMKKNVFNDIFKKLCVKRYAFDVELLTLAKFYGLKVVEMPVKLKVNNIFKLNELVKMFLDLIGIAYRLRITHWYQRIYAGN
jgi:glycosyltransferase involved in cell wall biosynthesis